MKKIFTRRTCFWILNTLCFTNNLYLAVYNLGWGCPKVGIAWLCCTGWCGLSIFLDWFLTKEQKTFECILNDRSFIIYLAKSYYLDSMKEKTEQK